MTVLAKLARGVLTGVAMAGVLGAAGAHAQAVPPPAPPQAVYPQAAPPAQAPLVPLDPRAARIEARYQQKREKLALRYAREREKLAAAEQHRQAAQAARATVYARGPVDPRTRGYTRELEAGEQARIAALEERERRRAAKLAERAARVEAVRIERERRLEARERERAARLAYARERGQVR